MSLKMDPDKHHLMPACFGPPVLPEVTRFDAMVTLAVRFVTDRARLQALLPDFFEVPEDPIVVVGHTHNVGVDWLGGRTYQLVRVDTRVTFRGREETVTGPFGMVIWESEAKPVIVGRELWGNQKIAANVPPHVLEETSGSFECFEYESRLLHAELSNLRPVSDATLAKMQGMWEDPDNVPLGWKYIPNLEGGADADYVTQTPLTGTFKSAMRGDGEIVFDRPSWKDAPGSAQIAAALASLPILEYRPAFVTHQVDTTLPRNRARIVR